MTIIFTGITSDFITMTVDSAVKQDFGDRREYETGEKIYKFPGVGFVATWGERTGNDIHEFLIKEISRGKHTVYDLADFVEKHLKELHEPDKNGFGEVGYHVAGFDRENKACLYHIFYGRDLPRSKEQDNPEYKRNDQSPKHNERGLFYNGRSDIATTVVHSLLNEIYSGKDTKFDLNSPFGMVYLGDLIVRFASELTKEVGPPFSTTLITKNNNFEVINNEKMCPIDIEILKEKLEKLGFNG